MKKVDKPPPAGLLHALLLDGQGSASDYPWDKVATWTPEQGCLWLHFDYSDPEVRQWVLDESGLNDIACDGLLVEETRPRAINRGDNLLIALRGINLQPDSQPDDMISLRVWTNGSRIISTRCRPLRATDDIRQQLESGNGPSDAATLLVEWIDRIVWRMTDTIESFEDELAKLEDAVLSDNLEGLRYELAGLRKKTIMIRRYLAPQREALNRMCSEPISWIDEMNRLRLREVADRQIRHLEDIDTIRERAAMTQEELLSRVSEQMNSRTFVLTIVAAIFLPLGFFTGLMGINVGGMPGVEEKGAFWIVVAICLVVMAILGVLFRFKRWL